MKRKKKRYEKPKKPFDKERIIEEEKIKKDFGLKNKKEIWKAESKVVQIRRRAKELISASYEEQEAFFDKLKKIGLSVSSIPEVLALNKEDYLKRRLQTVIVEKKIAGTTKAARQLITHKHITINGEVVNVPSYIVPVSLEGEIKLKMNPKLVVKKGESQNE